MRDQLLAVVRARLEAFAASQDPRIVLERGALDDVLALLAAADEEGSDVNVSHAAGWLFWLRFAASADAEGEADLERAMELLVPAYQALPSSVPQEVHDFFRHNGVPTRTDPQQEDARRQYENGTVLLGRYEQTGELAALRDAVNLLEQSVGILAIGYEQAIAAANLSVALTRLFHQVGDVEALHRSVDLGRFVEQALPAGHPSHTVATANFIGNLLARYEHETEPEVLEEAVATGRRAVTRTPEAHSAHSILLGSLSVALLCSFKATGDPAVLHEAVDTARRAATAHPDNREEQWATLGHLASVLQTRFEYTNDLAALQEAIDVSRRAVHGTAPEHPNHSRLAHGLGSALLKQYKHTGDPEILMDAIVACRRAVASTPDSHANLGVRLAGLAAAVRELYASAGDETYLDEAITLSRRALTVLSPGHSSRGAAVNILSVLLMDKHDRTGEATDLDELVAVCRQVLDSTPEGDVDLASRQSNLCLALMRGYESSRDSAVLSEAILLGRQSLTSMPENHAEYEKVLNHLGIALKEMFDRTGDPAVLEEAIDVGRRAVGTTQLRGSSRAAVLGNLGAVLQLRFSRTGDLADLNEAIAADREALGLIADAHPDRPTRLANISAALLQRFDQTGDPAALEEAVAAGQESARRASPGQSNRGSILYNLGKALQRSYEHTGQRDARDEAVAALRGASLVESAAPSTRIWACEALGQLSIQAGDWDEALQAFSYAVELLPLAAARNLQRGDQEHGLGQFRGLAAEAAACALQQDDPERAVSLLEQGRGVLLGQALDFRSDLSDLRRQAPDTADHFIALREQLAAADTDVMIPMSSGSHTSVERVKAAGRTAEVRRRLARDWHELIAQIRTLPGLHGFLRPLELQELLGQTSEGPCVLLNVGSFRSDALLLTTAGVTVVTLPRLSQEAVLDHAQRFVAALDAAHDTELGIRKQLQAQQDILKTLRWLWDAAAEPVLEELGLIDVPGVGYTWPHIWWSPGGLLSYLPLHAAGYHDEGHDHPQPRAVIDRVVSSYTPTIRALARARTHPCTRAAHDELLVVAMPHTPAASDLPGAAREADLLSAIHPTRALIGAEATHSAVCLALGEHAVAHLACHGLSDQNGPSNSRLLLHDHQTRPLTVSDISRLDLQSAQLAYLSACSTSRTSPYLADEAVHITTAFQLAGYPHVIGTLWPVDDRLAADIAASVYEILRPSLEELGTSGHLIADALHEAVRTVRSTYPGTPSLWAGHVHTGA